MQYYNRDRDDVPALLILGKPHYYDSPEGTKPWEKIWGLNKYAIPTALVTSLCDILFHSRAKNIIECANVTGHWLIPLVGLSTAFTSVTYIAANARQKDDKINYACGVLACSPILQAWKKSTAITLWGTAILMAVALIKKTHVDNGWIMFPDNPLYCGTYTCDFTMTKEWPRRPI